MLYIDETGYDIYVTWQKELTPNDYLPEEPLHTQTKQLLRMVFPGSKKCLHA